MLIRDLTAHDLDRALAINEANVPEVGPVDRDRLAFLVEEAAIALVVDAALDDGPTEIAGFVIVLPPGSTYDSINYRWFMDRYDDALYLDRVAFDERFQGQGFGRAIYDEVDARMRRDHTATPVLALEVNVDPPNEPSLRFHARQGFTEVGRQMSKSIEVSLMTRTIT